MLIDLQTEDPPAADRLRADVCIVGGGLAGLTLAQALAAAGVRVVVLEAGGALAETAAADPFDDAIFGVEIHRGTAEGRVRALGGSTLRWGGQLLPMQGEAPESVDLPDNARYTAWPLPVGTLAFHYGDGRLGAKVGPFEAARFFGDAGRRPFAAAKRPALPKLVSQMQDFEARVSTFVPFRRRNVGQTLGRCLRLCANATVVLHAQVTALRSTGGRVTEAVIRTPAGSSVRVEAAHVVLAAGTVETCRLLLVSALGQEHGQVGLGLHDHLTVTAATATGAARRRLLGELRPWVMGGRLHSLKLEASVAMQRRLGLLPSMAHLVIEEPEDSGLGMLRDVLRASQRGGLVEALRGVLPRLPAALGQAARYWLTARLEHRRYVSARAAVGLRINVAQEVSPLNRVRLSGTADASGMPGVVVDWSVRAPERATLRRFTRELKAQLARAGVDGGLAWNEALLTGDDDAPLPPLEDARHAMGGAIMGTDPRCSVVSPELRVHGLSNLWVASPAVFPDGSAQLPGLTLVALCLRLAETLTGQLGR